ncbi:rRNA adenine N-6-methyltransferase family protein [Halobacillus rhizosphaerae]|uniref:rRNA adenine N-6-methyltransferase family protein n=1 Tax=Halobacillus rhizosphaerae TaxID=3064889 RepID=UPI00398BA392
MFIIIALILIIFILLMLVIGTIATGITPTPTSAAARKKIFEISSPHTPDSIAELGAGFGAMTFSYARQFPNAKITAYEMSWFPWMILLLRKLLFRYRNVYIIRKDFFKLDLTSHDFLYTYLYPGAMRKLSLKIHSHRKFTLVSNTFHLPDWSAAKKARVPHDLSSSCIYIYKKP